ncbi:MAG: glycine cleavage system protein GcvH [Caldiserica bacterium]|jgi:glycine cleavage system H protein|nr:glycine cleavage system protein GcvH [Caldisericota bacterium]MDH7562108.1 glycine cleavage system protein GcvH [Caldisericota bacterium]
MSEVKQGLKYTKEHEWALIEGNRAKVGVTDFAQAHLGDIVYVDLPHLGKEVKQGETLLVVESVKTASDVYAPLSGKVVEINNLLSKNPEKVNSDPYGEGWMAVIEISDPEEEAELLSPEEYKAHIETLS